MDLDFLFWGCDANRNDFSSHIVKQSFFSAMIHIQAMLLLLFFFFLLHLVFLNEIQVYDRMKWRLTERERARLVRQERLLGQT